MKGESLSGIDVLLPEDVEGDINLVFVAFRRWHQPIIDRWLRRIGPNEAGHPGRAVWNLGHLS